MASSKTKKTQIKIYLHHRYNPYQYYTYTRLKSGKIKRQKWEGSDSRDITERVYYRKTMSVDAAVADIEKKHKNGWIIGKRNPVIRPPVNYFKRHGQILTKMRRVQQEIYDEIGKWLSFEEIDGFLKKAQVTQRRKQIRVIK